MAYAPDHTTKSTAAAPAAGVVTARAMAAIWVGLTTNFVTDRKHPLAERRTG
jgi:hypothetical protein